MKEGIQPGVAEMRFKQAMQQSDAEAMAMPNETALYEPDNFVVFEPVQHQQQEQQMVQQQIQGNGMKPNQIRHSENLHGNGKPGVNGLTGYYHGQFYDRGIPMKSSEKGGDDQNGR